MSRRIDNIFRSGDKTIEFHSEPLLHSIDKYERVIFNDNISSISLMNQSQTNYNHE